MTRDGDGGWPADIFALCIGGLAAWGLISFFLFFVCGIKVKVDMQPAPAREWMETIMDYNKVIIAGRLTADPELKAIPNGESVAQFSLALNRKDKQGAETTDFFDCVAYGKTAESIAAHLRKGRAVLLEGRLRQRRWESKEGEKRSKVEVVVSLWQFADARPADDTAAPRGDFKPMTPPAYRRQQPPAPEPGEVQEEIPF